MIHGFCLLHAWPNIMIWFVTCMTKYYDFVCYMHDQILWFCLLHAWPNIMILFVTCMTKYYDLVWNMFDQKRSLFFPIFMDDQMRPFWLRYISTDFFTMCLMLVWQDIMPGILWQVIGMLWDLKHVQWYAICLCIVWFFVSTYAKQCYRELAANPTWRMLMKRLRRGWLRWHFQLMMLMVFSYLCNVLSLLLALLNVMIHLSFLLYDNR